MSKRQSQRKPMKRIEWIDRNQEVRELIRGHVDVILAQCEEEDWLSEASESNDPDVHGAYAYLNGYADACNVTVTELLDEYGISTLPKEPTK